MTAPIAQTSAGRPRAWTGRTRGGVAGNWIFAQVLRVFGLRLAYVLLAPVALYYMLAAPKARRAAAAYRRRIGYDTGGGLRRFWNGLKHFTMFGKLLLDRAAMIAGSAERFEVDFDGEDRLRTALAEGKGLLLVSAHVGNWEMFSGL